MADYITGSVGPNEKEKPANLSNLKSRQEIIITTFSHMSSANTISGLEFSPTNSLATNLK